MSPDIYLYGKPTLRFQEIQEEVKSLGAQLGLSVRIKIVSEVDIIISKGITEIPSISVGGMVIPCGKHIPTQDFLDQTASHLLKFSNCKSMRNILIPIDFTDEANGALEFGAALAKHLDCQAQVLHVDHPTPVAAEGMVTIGYIDEGEKKRQLDKLVSQYQNTTGKEIINNKMTAEYSIGLAADEIVERSGDFDLIIMGSKRSTNKIMRWLGSVSNVVVRNSKCPVLIVPPGVQFAIPETILFGYDPHPKAEEHVEELIRFKDLFNSSLHIAHINRSGDDPRLIQDLEQYMNHVFPNTHVQYHSQDAQSIEEGLIQKANEIQANMICIAKTEKSIWSFMIHGNRSESLLGLSDRPLLVLNRITE